VRTGAGIALALNTVAAPSQHDEIICQTVALAVLLTKYVVAICRFQAAIHGRCNWATAQSGCNREITGAGDPSLETCEDVESLVRWGTHIGNEPIIGWHVRTRMPTSCH